MTGPQSESGPTGVPVPDVVFENFDDPSKAARLSILKYDEELGEIESFEVSKNSTTGAWTIPSNSNYPADATDQMRDAALILVDLNVLGLVTEDASEHELFGVLEPSNSTKLGDKGIGTLVAFEDETGSNLARLIIGKQVKGEDGQRFVRIPQQDRVYAVAIDPEKLSTSFEDWIEPDLLQMNTLDVEQMRIKDYSIVETTQGPTLELGSDASISFNSTDSKWSLDELLTYRGQKSAKIELGEYEELDNTKLNDAKSALDDLKIVDVKRKPAGLGADLKADRSFMDNKDNLRSLRELGFYPNRVGDDQIELLSANGELHIMMKDGYEYVMRFGGAAGTDTDEGGLRRYLFVTARVDPSKFPRPKLEELPPDPNAKQEETGGCGQEETQEETPSEDSPQEPSEEKPAEPAAEEQAEEDPSAEEAPSQEPAEKAEQPAEAATEEPAAEQDVDEAERKLIAERERITKENQRKLDEWNENKKKAEEKVRELNTRFADWYYVISDEVYRKIHLDRTDYITESESAKEEGFGVDALRGLEESGLSKEPPEAAAPAGIPQIPGLPPR